MDFYIDITIQPDAEMPQSSLMNKVYSKFHKVLFDLNCFDVGVSFPETRLLLGKVLRVHSSKNRLLELNKLNWLGGLSGYCKVSNILPIPENIKFRIVSRWQCNMSESNLRRMVKRGTINKNEAKNYRAKMFKQQMTTLPFIEVDSNSNGNHHRRYIQMSELLEASIEGSFDFFGLSKKATIPWF